MSLRQRDKWIGLVLIVALAGAACGTDAPMAESKDSPSTPRSESPVSCPNPEFIPENKCLGEIGAGTYTTQQFHPTLTYTVPEGWSNYEDLPGQFLLLPPGADISGVDPGTSDYIGVYASTAAPRQDCSGRPDRSVPASAADYLAWLRANPALHVSAAEPITIAAHEGNTVEVSLRPGKGPCSDPAAGLDSFAEFAIGVPPSEFSASVIPTLDYRLDVFDLEDRMFLILVAEPRGGGSGEEDWASTAQRVVGDFSF